jgi:CheY-like chemotaxis protein
MLERSNILIVDDRLDKRVVFRTILEELDQNIVTASSGEEALRWLLDNDCAVILLDVNMPGIDGYEVCRRMRGMRHLDRVPIAFITSNRTAADLARAREVGGNDFIVKPFTIQKLQDRVRHWVSRRVG